MKRPAILLALIVLAVAAAGWWFDRVTRGEPAVPREEVAIRDRMTIDFSSGQPVVRDDAAEKALIDAAMKEIESAAKHIRFAPLVPPNVNLPLAEKK